MRTASGGTPDAQTIAERLIVENATGFIGRKAELARVDGMLGRASERTIVFVHGPGGIGKSTFVREVVRRAEAAGWTPVAASVADLVERDRALNEMILAVRDAARPIVAIDDWEQVGASSGAIRDDVLADLPGDAVVVLAGRQPPDIGWWGGGWERLVVEIELPPLSREESTRLLGAHGVEAPARQSMLAGWAAGSPLALVLAAGVATDWRPDQDSPPPRLVSRLSQRLLEVDIGDDRVGVLAVAAVARVTTRDVLAAALPGEDAEEAYDWLMSRSFIEPRDGGLAPHALVARVLAAEADRRYPDVVRDIRRRLADHLWLRAVGDGVAISADLLHLIQDPAIRWGIGCDSSDANRVDRVREGDADAIHGLLERRGSLSHWSWIRRYLAEAAVHVGVVRSRSGAVVGTMVSAAPSNPAPLTSEDPLLGPWLDHARRSEAAGNAVLWRHAIDFTDSVDGAVQRLMGSAGVSRSGLANPRYVYLPIDPSNAAARAFAAAMRAIHVAELDYDDGERVTECHIGDAGPGGILSAHRAAVYLDLGLPVPPDAALTATAEAVRDVLRAWDDPNQLARSALANGSTVAERVESVRRVITEAADREFGHSPGDLLLRRILETGYLERRSNHDANARTLNLSRAAYFRRLKEATERLAAGIRR